jgi:hypothetical protein
MGLASLGDEEHRRWLTFGYLFIVHTRVVRGDGDSGFGDG